MSAMIDQIAAFKRALPQLRRDHGASWAVLVDEDVKGTFPEFKDAANFAVAHFAEEDVLIRHTDEAQEIAPFLVLDPA